MDPARLTAIKPFAGLGPRDLDAIAAWAIEESLPAGQVLMLEDDFAPDLLGVLEGRVEVRRGEKLIAALGPGEIVGELGCLSRARRSATVIATTPVQVVRLTHWDMRHLQRSAPGAVAAIEGVSDARLRAA